MQSTNPYSAPPPVVESPDLVIQRQGTPFVLGFFGAGLFPLMWMLGYLHVIDFGVPLFSFFGIGVWLFTFPVCITCLCVLVKKPAPVIELIGDVLTIRDFPFRSTGTHVVGF